MVAAMSSHKGWQSLTVIPMTKHAKTPPRPRALRLVGGGGRAPPSSALLGADAARQDSPRIDVGSPSFSTDLHLGQRSVGHPLVHAMERDTRTDATDWLGSAIREVVEQLRPVWEGVKHNVSVLVLMFIATRSACSLPSCSIEMRGSRSIRRSSTCRRAVPRDRGLDLAAPVLAGQRHDRLILRGFGWSTHRTVRYPSINLWAALVCRELGMWLHHVLYLAGLKSVDPSLREPRPSTARTATQPTSRGFWS